MGRRANVRMDDPLAPPRARLRGARRLFPSHDPRRSRKPPAQANCSPIAILKRTLSWQSTRPKSNSELCLVQPCGLERFVDISPFAPDGLCDLGGTHPFLAQRHDARAIERGRAAFVNALRLCGVDASTLPITDEAKLHLRNHP